MQSLTKFIRTSVILLILSFTLLSAQNPTPTITTEKVADNLYKMFIYVDDNSSINIYAFIGKDGVLLIDGGFANTAEKIKDELKKITDKEIKYIINTHSDGDHTNNNALFNQSAVIIAHNNCRTQLMANARFPIKGLPNITFQDSTTIFFNEEEILMRYFPGHTTTDITVYFKKAGIAFLGDMIFSDAIPLIHPYGNIYMYEKSLKALTTLFPANTRIFVSHGREIQVKEIKPYYEMFTKTKDIVLKAIKSGKLPDDVKKADLLKDYKSWNSKLFPSMDVGAWIDNLYSALNEGKKLSAYNVLKGIFDKSGKDAAIAKYKNMNSPGGKKYFFIETEFNAWGYALLGAKNTDMAIEVFKMNTEKFPESWNTFDSLGETYAAIGKKELAIANYEKSLKLNPNSQSGKDALKQLKGNN